MGLGLLAFTLLRPTGPNLSSGDCISSMPDVKKVPCESSDAAWKIGDGCDAMLEITMNGGKDSYCASKVED